MGEQLAAAGDGRVLGNTQHAVCNTEYAALKTHLGGDVASEMRMCPPSVPGVLLPRLRSSLSGSGRRGSPYGVRRRFAPGLGPPLCAIDVHPRQSYSAVDVWSIRSDCMVHGPGRARFESLLEQMFGTPHLDNRAAGCILGSGHHTLASNRGRTRLRPVTSSSTDVRSCCSQCERC